MNRRSFIARFVGGIAGLAIAGTAFKETFTHPERGFTLTQDPFPARFVMNDGQWEQVEVFRHSSKAVSVNPAWVRAPYEVEIWTLDEESALIMKERA